MTTHRARIDKKSLITRYTAGERNFRFLDLGELNLSGANLSGADFTGSDIRGTNFTDANLSGARLADTQGGISATGANIQSVLAMLIPVVATLSVLAATHVSLLLSRDSISFALQPAVLCYVFALAARLPQGSTHKSDRKILGVLLALMCTVPLFIGGIGHFLGLVLTQTVGIASVLLMSIPFFGKRKGTVYATAGFSVVYALLLPLSGIQRGLAQVYVVWTAILLLSTWLVGKQPMGPRHRLLVVHRLTRSFSMLGTTSFRGANLSDVAFNGGYLRRVNFSNSRQQTTNLRGTCWKDVHQLNTAYFGPDYSTDSQLWQDFSD